MNNQRRCVPVIRPSFEPLREAVDFLRAELADGPVMTKELQVRAKEAGISWVTVKRAKQKAGVKSTKLFDEQNRIKGWELRLVN